MGHMWNHQKSSINNSRRLLNCSWGERGCPRLKDSMTFSSSAVLSDIRRLVGEGN